MATASFSDSPSPLAPRALASLSSHLSTELGLLARIHYKNQSQHRLSLFWRRVDEVKRLGDKVQAGWVAWDVRVKGSEAIEVGGKASQERKEELRKLGLLLEKVASWDSSPLQIASSVTALSLYFLQLHLSLPKLHTSLHQLVLLTHFLPLVTVLLGMTARLWGLSAGLYDHLRAIWSRDFSGKRPWKKLDGGVVVQEEEEQVVATSRPPSTRGSTPATISQATIIATFGPPSPVPLPPVVDLTPPEHGEVIQRRAPPSRPTPPSFSSTTGTVIARQPYSVPLKRIDVLPSKLQDEPITYADDSDSDTSSPPPPKPKAVALPPSPPPIPFLSTPTLVKPIKRPIPALVASPSLVKRTKVDASRVEDPPRKKKTFTSGVASGTGSEKSVAMKKKKVRRDEMDDIFG